MTIFDGYDQHFRANARMIILKALADEADYRLNEVMLRGVLEAFAIKRGRDWLRIELRWLDEEAGAIRRHEVGSVIVAELTEAGLDHIERRRVLDGIQKPSPVRG